jgi:hypothetical protein
MKHSIDWRAEAALPPPIPLDALELNQFKPNGRYYGVYKKVADRIGCSETTACNVARQRRNSPRVLRAVREEMARVDAEIAAQYGGR